MRPPPKHCPHCGARVLRPGTQGACDYCGAELELAVPAHRVERARRFARLKADPGLPELLRRPVGGGGRLVGATFALVIVAGMVVFGVVMATAAAAFSGGFALFPLVFVAIALLGFVQLARRTTRFATDPGRATLALVVDERVHVSGGESSHTQNYATIEDEDGQRRELETTSEVAGRIAPGDVGVAYERGGFLVHFARVDA